MLFSEIFERSVKKFWFHCCLFKKFDFDDNQRKSRTILAKVSEKQNNKHLWLCPGPYRNERWAITLLSNVNQKIHFFILPFLYSSENKQWGVLYVSVYTYTIIHLILSSSKRDQIGEPWTLVYTQIQKIYPTLLKWKKNLDDSLVSVSWNLISSIGYSVSLSFFCILFFLQ